LSDRPPQPLGVAAGIACGVGAAVFWAAGLVAARHGIAAGLTPADINFHRFVWAGVVLLPLMMREGLRDLGGVGWRRGLLITLFGGPLLGLLSYAGFLLVPLGHGAIIQPSTAALSGLLLSSLVLKEQLPFRRAIGAAVIIGGLMVIGSEALATIGAHGLLGDLCFAAAGFSFSLFGMLLRLWGVAPMRAVRIVSVASLGYLPLHAWFAGFDSMAAAGMRENLLQILVQGVFAGAGAIYLFTRSVVMLGAGRAAVFPSLVPAFTLLIGFASLGEAPTALQLIGLTAVLAGFRLTQRA
jgi:drug/metabolite transporter (DMT)-like permease